MDNIREKYSPMAQYLAGLEIRAWLDDDSWQPTDEEGEPIEENDPLYGEVVNLLNDIGLTLESARTDELAEDFLVTKEYGL